MATAKSEGKKNFFRKTPSTQKTSYSELSCQNRWDSVESLLAKKVDVNTVDNTGRTLLHFAIIDRDMGRAKLLLKHKADCNFYDNDGNTPLHCTVLGLSSEFTDLLIKAKANVLIKNSSDQSAMDIVDDLLLAKVMPESEGEAIKTLLRDAAASAKTNKNTFGRDESAKPSMINNRSVFLPRQVPEELDPEVLGGERFSRLLQRCL